MALTNDENADCLKALKAIREGLAALRKLADYNGIDDIATSIDALDYECRIAEDDYLPRDPDMYEVGRGGF